VIETVTDDVFDSAFNHPGRQLEVHVAESLVVDPIVVGVEVPDGFLESFSLAFVTRSGGRNGGQHLAQFVSNHPALAGHEPLLLETDPAGQLAAAFLVPARAVNQPAVAVAPFRGTILVTWADFPAARCSAVATPPGSWSASAEFSTVANLGTLGLGGLSHPNVEFTKR